MKALTARFRNVKQLIPLHIDLVNILVVILIFLLTQIGAQERKEFTDQGFRNIQASVFSGGLVQIRISASLPINSFLKSRFSWLQLRQTIYFYKHSPNRV